MGHVIDAVDDGHIVNDREIDSGTLEYKKNAACKKCKTPAPCEAILAARARDKSNRGVQR